MRLRPRHHSAIARWTSITSSAWRTPSMPSVTRSAAPGIRPSRSCNGWPTSTPPPAGDPGEGMKRLRSLPHLWIVAERWRTRRPGAD
jgi:hypothetical protein